MSFRLLLCAVMALMLTLPAAALAEVRVGTAPDPVDEPDSGADVTSLHVDFDTDSGHLVLAVSYAVPLPETTNGTFYAHIGIGTGFSHPNGCDLTDYAPVVDGALDGSSATYTPYKELGKALPARKASSTLSEDRKTVKVTMDDADFVGRNYNCVDGASFWNGTEVVDGVDAHWFDGFPRVPPGPALSAQARYGAVSDPVDTTPSLSGIGEPDIRDVSTTYDPASGFIEIVVRFYGAYDPNGGGANWTRASFSVGTLVANDSTGSGYTCSSAKGGLSSDLYGVTVNGYEGQLSYSSYFNSDFTEMTLRVASNVLAGRDYQCSYFGLARTKYSTASNPSSSYSSGCNCWLVGAAGDSVDRDVIFNGFQRPACADNLDNDNDKRVDLEDPGCRGLSTAPGEADPKPVLASLSVAARVTRGCSARVTPAPGPVITPPELFAFARTQVRLRGLSKQTRSYDRTRKAQGTLTFRRLRPGKYKLTARYPGDAFRTRSPARSKTLRVPRRCARAPS